MWVAYKILGSSGSIGSAVYTAVQQTKKYIYNIQIKVYGLPA